MSPDESLPGRPDDHPDQPPIQCPDCESALHGDGDQRLTFLLLDQHTIPLLACDEHLAQFATVCGYTTSDTATLLDHRPAGGLACPSCHLAPNRPQQPVVPIQDGAVGVLACPEHQATIFERFQQGLATKHQLTASLDT